MRRNRRGFTLLEILLVVAILVVLAGSATVLVMRQYKQGLEKTAKLAVSPNGEFAKALDLFYKDLNRYPTSEEGLKSLLAKPEGAEDAEQWGGPYLSQTDLKDPWGTEYQYKCPGEHNTETFDLSSAGQNKTHGDEDDVANWVSEEAGN